MSAKPSDQTLEAIARKHLRVPTLKARNSDALDFHDVGVGSLRAALTAAFVAGVEARAEAPAAGERPSLAYHFDKLARESEAALREGIAGSRWLKSAPAELRSSATVTILGVEDRPYRGMVTHPTMHPTLLAVCECGGERQGFGLRLDGGVYEVFPLRLEEAEAEPAGPTDRPRGA